MQAFDPEKFTLNQVETIRRTIGRDKALIAISGGVDSTTSAVLTHKAIGDNLVCVILDDAFMRENEPETVRNVLSKSPLSLPLEVVDVREEFLSALSGIRDAEEKRRVFRETFYSVLARVALEKGCRYLVQGTILADIIETKGGIKTQHNVLEQIGIHSDEKYGFKVVEPLASLLKWQVREVARYLGLPRELSERQPFPGPGLAVRVVGEITEDKLNAVKRATSVVENEVAQFKPSQYFPAVLDNVEEGDSEVYRRTVKIASSTLRLPKKTVSVKLFRDRATGIKDGKRVYGRVLGIKALRGDGSLILREVDELIPLQAKIIEAIPTTSRILYAVGCGDSEKPHVIVVRSVETEDFLTAKVSNLPITLLLKVATNILDVCKTVSEVYYDLTPKPPATIEME